jgi:NADPH:quinone reductase-like Zn-dependent oxidoreductase
LGSDAKIEPAKALGADHVINYREDRFEGVVRKLTKKRGVDVVFEHVGADTWAGSMLSLKRGGRLVTCGSTSGVSTQMNLMMLFQQQLKLLGSFGCRMENMADAMQKMAAGHWSIRSSTPRSVSTISTPHWRAWKAVTCSARLSSGWIEPGANRCRTHSAWR